MLHAIAQGIVGCLIFSGIYFALSGISLTFYVAKYRPSQNDLRVFLTNLKFPMDRIVGLLPTGKPDGASEYLSKIEYRNAQVLRYVSSLVIIGILILIGYGLLQQSSKEGRITASMIFIFCCIGSYLAWRFGHKFVVVNTKSI